MKSKGIIIAVIALLSVWAVLATITAVDNENRRSRLYDERAELREECERQERAYEKLEAEYEKLLNERVVADKDRYLKGLAYEMAYDMSVGIVNGEEWDYYTAYAKIMTREVLGITDMQTVMDYLAEILEETTKDRK